MLYLGIDQHRKQLTVNVRRFLMQDACSSGIILGSISNPNGGRVQVAVNGKTLLSEMEAYAEHNTLVQTDLPPAELNQGENTITVKLLGKHPQARGQAFYLDYIEIWR